MGSLVERLTAMYSHRGDAIPTQYANPDGPEAAARIRELEALGTMVAKILPSAAGLDDAPASKIIACYLSMGELRAIRQALAKLEKRNADQ